MPSGINTFDPPVWQKFDNTEKVVGTWINGETVYERTITGTTPSTVGPAWGTSTDDLYALVSNVNISTMLMMKGSVKWYSAPTSYGYAAVPFFDNNTNGNYFTLAYNPVNKSVYCFHGHTATWFNNQPYEITLTYIK